MCNRCKHIPPIASKYSLELDGRVETWVAGEQLEGWTGGKEIHEQTRRLVFQTLSALPNSHKSPYVHLHFFSCISVTWATKLGVVRRMGWVLVPISIPGVRSPDSKHGLSAPLSCAGGTILESLGLRGDTYRRGGGGPAPPGIRVRDESAAAGSGGLRPEGQPASAGPGRRAVCTESWSRSRCCTLCHMPCPGNTCSVKRILMVVQYSFIHSLCGCPRCFLLFPCLWVFIFSLG